MSGTWINRVRHVNDGEAVNGAIDSRPTRALEGNTQYLKDRIDSAELGEGVIAYGETVERRRAGRHGRLSQQQPLRSTSGPWPPS